MSNIPTTQTQALNALTQRAARAARWLLGAGNLTVQELQHNIDHIEARLGRANTQTKRFALTRERADLQRLLDARQAQDILTQ